MYTIPATVLQVVLAGGCCKVPRLRELLAKELPASELLCSVPADHVVTLGAAMQAALLMEYADKLPGLLPPSLPCSSKSIYISVSVHALATSFHTQNVFGW